MVEALHLQELLHNLTQALLYPTMAVLLLLIVFAVWCVGSVIVEGVVERRHFRVAMPELLARVDAAPYAELFGIVESSGLLGRQKRDLQTLVAYGYLPEEARVALAKRLLAAQEDSWAKVLSRTETMAKISPMIGLMGTLIPLGPGVVALGQAQTELLSSSIMIAFDTTIAGLVVAVVAMLVSRARRRWYADYMSASEAVMAAVLEKARLCSEAGERLGDAASAAEMALRSSQLHPRRRSEKSAAADLAAAAAGQTEPSAQQMGQVEPSGQDEDTALTGQPGQAGPSAEQGGRLEPLGQSEPALAAEQTVQSELVPAAEQVEQVESAGAAFVTDVGDAIWGPRHSTEGGE